MTPTDPSAVAASATVAPDVEGRRARRRALARRVAIAAVWVAVLVAWWSTQRSTGLGAAAAAQHLVDRADAAWWGVVAYVAVYLVRPVVLFPASLLTVAGGLLFGPVVGVVVVVVAANASAMVAYGIGRALGRTPDDDRSDTTVVRRWTGRLRERGFESVLVMRLLFLPYDAVNYLCGVVRIPPVQFLTATALGSLPGTVSFVLLGASIERIDEGLEGIDATVLAGSLVIFVASLVVARALRRRTAAGGVAPPVP